MREILFRGKRKDNGEWVDGYYNGRHIVMWHDKKVCTDDEYIIMPMQRMIDVILETVGQYTGLTDKNGKKIFEGDILEFIYDDAKSFHIVQWSYEYAGWATQNIDEKYDAETMDFWDEFRGCYEIIGNIHDNPELLEE